MKINKILTLVVVAVLNSFCVVQAMNMGYKMLQYAWNHKGKLTLLGLGLAGVADDRRHSKKWQCVDASTPRQLMVLDNIMRNDIDGELVGDSVTKRQLMNDDALLYSPLVYAKRYGSTTYEDAVDATLWGHFWVMDASLRSMLCKLALHMSVEEEEFYQQGNVSMVHGTNKGASILLRTIFDEVLNDHEHNNHVLLREKAVLQELKHYVNIHEYYDEQEGEAKMLAALSAGVPSSQLPQERELMQILSCDKSQNLLCSNFGLFGQSSWIMHGYKESSAEFLVAKCSRMYQLASVLYSSLYKPWLPFLVVRDLIKNPELCEDLNQAFEYCAKHANKSDFESIFAMQGAQELYPLYQEELERMQTVAGAGLVHMFIPKEDVKSWGYVSKQCGIRDSSNPEETYDIYKMPSALVRCQSRLLMHPDLCDDIKMRFYLIGESEKIALMIDRMYEIAAAVKQQRDSVN